MNRELIESLPEDLREIAEHYLPFFEHATTSELFNWLELIDKGRWSDAYKFAVGKMTTDQLVAQQNRLNGILVGLNQANADLIDAQRKCLQEMLLTLLTLGLATLQKK